MILKVTMQELMDKDWEKACSLLGINEWCLKDGLVDSTTEVELTEEQARELNFIN